MVTCWPSISIRTRSRSLPDIPAWITVRHFSDPCVMVSRLAGTEAWWRRELHEAVAFLGLSSL